MAAVISEMYFNPTMNETILVAIEGSYIKKFISKRIHNDGKFEPLVDIRNKEKHYVFTEMLLESGWIPYSKEEIEEIINGS